MKGGRKGSISGQVLSFFALILLTSCLKETPPVPLSPPPLSAEEKDRLTVKRIKTDISLQHFALARKRILLIHGSALRKSWENRLRNAWAEADISRAESFLKKDSLNDALNTVDTLRKRDRSYIESHSETFPEDLSEACLNHLIETGKELQAITESRTVFQLPAPLKQKIAVMAYTHLAQRRLAQGKDHYAYLDARRGLLLDPKNPALLNISSTLRKKEQYLTEQGFREYGKQHLRRALLYWKDALLLDPKDPSLHSNIVQAKKMLERLKDIEHVEHPPAKPVTLKAGGPP